MIKSIKAVISISPYFSFVGFFFFLCFFFDTVFPSFHNILYHLKRWLSSVF
nr:MAG TPA: hypothetical protein [Caudoviricetes sp.]